MQLVFFFRKTVFTHTFTFQEEENKLAWPSPNMNLIEEVCDSLRKVSLTSFVGTNWSTGRLGPYDLIWPRVKEEFISNPLFAFTGLRCKIWQSVVCSGVK